MGIFYVFIKYGYADISIISPIKSNDISNDIIIKNRQYSTHLCQSLLDNHRKPTHVCEFNNICFSTKKKEFIYFAYNNNIILQHTENKTHNIYLTNNKLTRFPIQFFCERKYKSNEKYTNIDFTPTIIQTSIQNYTNKNGIHWFNNPSFTVSLPFTPENFGHFFGDNVLIWYRMLNYFGEYYPNSRLILLYNIELIGGYDTNEYYKTNSYKFFSQWNKIMFNDEMINLSNNSNVNFNYISKGIELLCFNKIIASQSKPQSVFGYRQSPYEVTKLVPIIHHKIGTYDKFCNKDRFNIVNYTQKVLFINKTDGIHRLRKWGTTVIELNQWISELKTKHKFQFKIITDRSIATLPIIDQIKFILDYDILIAPHGGISFIGLFMRKGSCIIIKDLFNPNSKKSHSPDEPIFDGIGWINFYRLYSNYKISLNNMNKTYREWRDLTSYSIDKNQFEFVLLNALQWNKNYQNL